MPSNWKGKALRLALKYGTKRNLKMGYKVGKMAYNAYKGSKQKSVGKVRDFGGTTQQHDARTVYRSKKMPYRKKKKWVRFVKKVKAVEVSDRAKQTILINTVSGVTMASNDQAWLECHLYPVGGNIAGCRDMDILLEDIGTYKENIVPGLVTNPTDAVGIARPQGISIDREDTRKELLMSSGTLDVTYTNVGEVNLEVDLYTIAYSRQSQGTNGSFLAAVADNGTYVNPINVLAGTSIIAASGIALSSRGATLFDLPYGMSRTGAKIMKKEKFFISVGSSITKNIRDPANHNFRRTTPDTVYAYKNLTQSLVACVKNIDETNTGGLLQKCTRSYKYTYEGQATPYNRYVTE